LIHGLDFKKLTPRIFVAICLSLDNTFKSAGKAVVVDKDKNRIKLLRGGILNVINERSEIMSWVRKIHARKLQALINLPAFLPKSIVSRNPRDS
jgi:hypothetical protein